MKGGSGRCLELRADVKGERYGEGAFVVITRTREGGAGVGNEMRALQVLCSEGEVAEGWRR